eukprot:TRINITY_DN61_c0_g2_i8.p1 TRINITY_DN61_c0_g2~~TRINITY_DN61_c0_g2_i8.p1  ORF type:complete len:105 (-),score=11.64 TRINITY_DN61_c0_g2_i8:861-1175(-)
MQRSIVESRRMFVESNTKKATMIICISGRMCSTSVYPCMISAELEVIIHAQAILFYMGNKVICNKNKKQNAFLKPIEKLVTTVSLKIMLVCCGGFTGLECLDGQ